MPPTLNRQACGPCNDDIAVLLSRTVWGLNIIDAGVCLTQFSSWQHTTDILYLSKLTIQNLPVVKLQKPSIRYINYIDQTVTSISVHMLLKTQHWVCCLFQGKNHLFEWLFKNNSFLTVSGSDLGSDLTKHIQNQIILDSLAEQLLGLSQYIQWLAMIGNQSTGKLWPSSHQNSDHKY